MLLLPLNDTYEVLYTYSKFHTNRVGECFHSHLNFSVSTINHEIVFELSLKSFFLHAMIYRCFLNLKYNTLSIFLMI